MDKNRAYDLLCNLLERATSSDTKTFLTSREIEALREILLSNDQIATFGVDSGSLSPSDELEPEFAKQLSLENTDLHHAANVVDSASIIENIAPDKFRETNNITSPNLISIEINEIEPDSMLCIDFGTSFSKAFVSIDNGLDTPNLIDLPIGDGSTGTQLTTPSEMLIEKEFIYFGSRARYRFESVDGPVERLVDSIKQFITLNADVSNLDENRLPTIQDPTQQFSKRDVLVLYLAHLMALTERALVNKGISANVLRRYTHPAWKRHNKEKNENEMRVMMSEAILLARSAMESFIGQISTSNARKLLDQLRATEPSRLPTMLIHEPVREATAAGAGALLNTPENMRTNYLVIDIGAGTTDVAAFFCRNEPGWERPIVAEITNAANAINVAGNILDFAFHKFVLENSSLIPDTEEYRAAGVSLRRDRRVYKERLFSTGQVIVQLPTDQNIIVTLDDFMNYEPVKKFHDDIYQMVAKSAFSVVEKGRLKLIATGGGSGLPIIKKLQEHGVEQDGKQISFILQDAIVSSVRETYPDLIGPYPQIAVALGGSLPNLPEQKSDMSGPITSAPPPVYISPSYKS